MDILFKKLTTKLVLILATFFPGQARLSEEVLPLPTDQPLHRIAFGSCGKSHLPQPIWNSAVDARPNVFIFAGDNIYADTLDMKVMRAKYSKLAVQPGFRFLLGKVPALATWDDHDYGADDSGADYPMKAASQEIFLDFFGAPKDSQRRATPGVYDAKLAGPAGKRTQLILLDKGELSVRDAGVGYPLFDLTASGLTQASREFHFAWPNRYRVANLDWGNNFGMVRVDWDREDPEIRLQILDESGDIAIQRKIPLSLLTRRTLSEANGIREQEVEAAVITRRKQLQDIRSTAASAESIGSPKADLE